MSLTPEALARQQIDAQLVAAGWIIQDYKAVDFSAGRGIALREVPLKTGPCDYLLLVDRHAVGVTLDIYTPDEVLSKGFDAAAKAKAAGLVQAFRDYIAQHHVEIAALQILYSRPYAQRLTEPMLKELEKKLRDTHATWTEDRLWDAFAVTTPAKVKGRSQPGRFADLVSLVRFALEQQPVLEPFSDSVAARFDSWIRQKDAEAHTSSSTSNLNSQPPNCVAFTADQRAWLELMRDHIATSLSLEADDFGYPQGAHA